MKFLEVAFIESEIAALTLKREEKRNALNIALMQEFCEALSDLESSACRALILSGQGSVFCAGMDLQEAENEDLIDEMASHIADLFTRLYTTPLVTIAAVHGDAIAGGGGLVAACDLALMARTARIGFPEVRHGLIAAQVATLLIRQISPRHTRELLLTGELIDSGRAREIGLVNRVVDGEKLKEETVAMAKNIFEGAPKAIKETKQLIDALIPSDFSEDLKLALAVNHRVRHSAEAKEGISSFLRKKKNPHYS